MFVRCTFVFQEVEEDDGIERERCDRSGQLKQRLAWTGGDILMPRVCMFKRKRKYGDVEMQQ